MQLHILDVGSLTFTSALYCCAYMSRGFTAGCTWRHSVLLFRDWSLKTKRGTEKVLAMLKGGGRKMFQPFKRGAKKVLLSLEGGKGVQKP